MNMGNTLIDALTGDDAIDLLADLCAHWKRHRSNNFTPKSIRAGIVLQCHEISSKDLSVRTIEDRIKQLEESRAHHFEREDNLSRALSSALGDIERLRDEIKQMKNARKRGKEKS